jgi:hypothetical protein
MYCATSSGKYSKLVPESIIIFCLLAAYIPVGIAVAGRVVVPDASGGVMSKPSMLML